MKIIKQVATLLSAIVLALSGVSCAEALPEEYGPDTFELINARLAEDALSEDDYAQCIKWYEEAQQDYINRFLKCMETSDTMDDFAKNGEVFNAEWDKKWPKMEKLKALLMSAKEEDMGKSNMERFQNCQAAIRDRMTEVVTKLHSKYDVDLKAAAAPPAGPNTDGKAGSNR